ncbi:copper resistance protein CopC [Planotetraspora sp. GP83]|uniref:copper resistance CopC family protein n=1 Tax=Planotetraspora sp. GP83 TaxID=3156264 RepID=UPI0035118F0B
MKKPPIAAVIAFVVTLLLGTALALPAQAHTSLKSSDPQKNAQVETLRKVTLEFTESVRFPVVIVRGANGDRYESGDPVVNGPKVSEAVADGVPPGRYTIAWRVVSEDGHPVEGEIPFTVVGAKTSSPRATASPPPAAEASAPPAPATTAGAAKDADDAGDDSPKIPGWLWAVVFGLAGIGIGMFLSVRKKP